MKSLCNLFLLLPFFASSQFIKNYDKTIDPHKNEIGKNIFRVLLSASTDTKFSLTGSYELGQQ